MKRYIYIGLFIICCSGITWAEPIMIVNPSVSTVEISRSDVAKIFLGKKKSWDNGEKITAFLLKGGSVHSTFVKRIVRKTPAQFSTHWKRMVFTGKGQALTTVVSEQEMIDSLKNTPGAVGYIDSSTEHDGVNIIKIK